ncbi:hypothetical protein ACJX0J_014275, partial [Zea mays]
FFHIQHLIQRYNFMGNMLELRREFQIPILQAEAHNELAMGYSKLLRDKFF